MLHIFLLYSAIQKGAVFSPSIPLWLLSRKESECEEKTGGAISRTTPRKWRYMQCRQPCIRRGYSCTLQHFIVHSLREDSKQCNRSSDGHFGTENNFSSALSLFEGWCGVLCAEIGESSRMAAVIPVACSQEKEEKGTSVLPVLFVTSKSGRTKREMR